MFWSIGSLVVLVVYFCYRADAKADKKRDADDDAWLAEEMKRPMNSIRIKFISTVGGNTIETEDYYPCIEYGEYGWHRSSLKAAEMDAENIMKRGYNDGNGSYYPAHTIAKIEIV